MSWQIVQEIVQDDLAFGMENFEGHWHSQCFLDSLSEISDIRVLQGQGMGELRVGASSVIETSRDIR